MDHFLLIEYYPYDGATTFGIFASKDEAFKFWAEQALSGRASAAAEVEQWSGGLKIATFANNGKPYPG